MQTDNMIKYHANMSHDNLDRLYKEMKININGALITIANQYEVPFKDIDRVMDSVKFKMAVRDIVNLLTENVDTSLE